MNKTQDERKIEERKTVCGGTLRGDDPGIAAGYKEQTYYFCTRGCLRAFWTDPEGFLAGEIEHPMDDE